MDKDAARKLNRMIWWGRVRMVLLVLLIVISIAGVVLYFQVEEDLAERSTASAVVETWTRSQDYTGNGDYVLRVRLADDTFVSAKGSGEGRAPVIGEQIELIRLETPSGRVIYNWYN